MKNIQKRKLNANEIDEKKKTEIHKVHLLLDQDNSLLGVINRKKKKLFLPSLT